MSQTVKLKRSNTINKLPTAGDLEYGELAINYAKDGEMLIIKNDQNEIIGFSSDAKLNSIFEIIAQSIATIQKDMASSPAIQEEHDRAVSAETTIANNLSDEVSRATSAETAIMNELTGLIEELNEKLEIASQAIAIINGKISDMETSGISGGDYEGSSE